MCVCVKIYTHTDNNIYVAYTNVQNIHVSLFYIIINVNKCMYTYVHIDATCLILCVCVYMILTYWLESMKHGQGH